MRTLIVYLLLILAISCHISRADDFDDILSEDYDSEEYTAKAPLTFKSFEGSQTSTPDEPKLIVTICYDDADRGYYCKDLP